MSSHPIQVFSSNSGLLRNWETEKSYVAPSRQGVRKLVAGLS